MLSHPKSSVLGCELSTMLALSFLSAELIHSISERSTVHIADISISTRKVLVKCGLKELDRSDQ